MKGAKARELDVIQQNLKAAKRAVAVLEKARTDPMVRGSATLEFVEDRLCRGQRLVQQLEAQARQLRHSEAYKTE